MMKHTRLVLSLLAFLVSAPALAQWQVQNHGIPVGKGAGVTGFSVAAPGTAGLALLSTGASSDPAFGAIGFNGLPSGVSDTVLGYFGGSVASATAVPNCLTGSLQYSTASHAFTCGSASVNANLVFYTVPLAGGVQQTATAKFSQTLSVRDFGAVGDGVTDDAPAFRAAYNAAPNGGSIYIPAPNVSYLMNSCDGNNAVLSSISTNANKAVSLYGDGWNIKTSGLYGSPRGSIIQLGPSIPNTCSFLRYAGTDIVTGVTLKDFALVASAGTFSAPVGLHGIFIDESLGGDAFYLTQMVIDHVFIDNMAAGYSIKIAANNSGVFSGGLAFSTIRNSQLMNINGVFWGDSILIDHNTFGQNATVHTRNVGIQFSQVSGATSTRITNNVFSNFDGMVVIDGAESPIIRDNEFEMGNVSNSNGALIDLNGSINTVNGAVVTGNSVSQNSTVANYAPIKIANAANTVVLNNTIRTPSSYDFVTITGGALATYFGQNRCVANNVVDLQCTLSSLGPAGSQYSTYSLKMPGTGGGTMIFQAPTSGGGTVTAPAGTTTLVGRNTTDTLVNKSMDGASNTFTNIPSSAVSSAALTRTNDTNVTLTLGGSPNTALLNATSLTLAWSGTLAASRGGFGSDVSAQSGVPLFAAGVPTFTGTSGSGNFVRATSPTITTPTINSISNSGQTSFLNGGSAGGIEVGSFEVGSAYSGAAPAGGGLFTNVAAPSSPAAGKVVVYTDSTDLRFHDKNASGTVGTTVVADTGAANNFLSAISAAGVISKSQPSCSSLSGVAASCSTDTTNASNISTGTLNTARLPGAYTAYTPTMACASGSLTAASSAGRWQQFGKTVLLTASITITTNGTCAGNLQIGIPTAALTSAGTSWIIVGADGSGLNLNCFVSSGGSAAACLKYDGTYPGVSGRTFFMTGSYEVP